MLPDGIPILVATSSISASDSPLTGSTNTLNIFSGVLCGHFLDVHAAFGRGHQRHALGDTINHHANVQFLLDVSTVFDQQASYLSALLAKFDG